jgi:acyl carrier protein
MRDVRVLCRWPEWQHFRKTLLDSGKVDEEKLNEIELTTEADSLEVVELIMTMEQAFGVEYVENPKS